MKHRGLIVRATVVVALGSVSMFTTKPAHATQKSCSSSWCANSCSINPCGGAGCFKSCSAGACYGVDGSVYYSTITCTGLQ